ncbi:hypothetical protein AAF712_010344 [Marasmius tenuissimus]|uniref:Uncharacterized protein n=1 Tax=Marasmius tenuissimus TaxID=585030 RepID=A0ABR2ZP10_9AGAR
MSLPRNKLAKVERLKLLRSKSDPPKNKLRFVQFCYPIPPVSVPLNTSEDANSALEAFEWVTDSGRCSREVEFRVATCACTECEHAVSWIHTFVSSIRTVEGDTCGFYRRVLSASAKAISLFASLVLDCGPSTSNEPAPAAPTFGEMLKAKQDFLCDLDVALDWAGRVDKERLFPHLARATVSLYGQEAMEKLFTRIDGHLGRYLEHFNDLTVANYDNVTSDLHDASDEEILLLVETKLLRTQCLLIANDVVSTTVLFALRSASFAQQATPSSREWVMKIMCRKLRLLCSLFVGKDWVSFTSSTKISLETSISNCLQVVALLTGQGGDSPTLRIALDEDILRSTYRGTTAQEDMSSLRSGNHQHALADAIVKIIFHIAASLPFPHIWEAVRTQLKAIDLTASEVSKFSPSVAAAWVILREEAGRQRFRAILAKLCANPDVIKRDLRERFRIPFLRYAGIKRCQFIINYGRYPPTLGIAKTRFSDNGNAQGIFFHSDIPLTIYTHVHASEQA